MNLTSAILQKTYEETYLRYTESIKLLRSSMIERTKAANDKIELSPDSVNFKNLGLNLTDSNVIQNNLNIDFKYNFADSLIQVQSKGNYNISEKSGNVNFNINLAQGFEKNNDKLNILPMELNVSLNFKLIEKNYTKESGSVIQKPDMLTIIQKIVERILDLIKDGQDKDIKLAFENPLTLSEFSQIANGKFAKMIYAWLESISKQVNSTDKDGKREKILLLVPDEKWQIDYEKRNMTISVSNISIELKFKSGETKTLILSDNQNTNQTTTEVA